MYKKLYYLHNFDLNSLVDTSSARWLFWNISYIVHIYSHHYEFNEIW